MTMEVEIRVAARWWADRLRVAFLQNIGESTPAERTGSALASLLTLQQPTLDEAAVQVFEESLAGLIQRDFNAGHSVDLSVDYHPSMPLQTAAYMAGFSLAFRLPVKTIMVIRPGEVSVASGYGRPFVSLELPEATPEVPHDTGPA